MHYVLKHLRPFFPGMTSQGAFNRWVRRLWGAFILLQQAISGDLLPADDCEVLDCVPVRVADSSAPFIWAGWPISPPSARAAMTVTSTACTSLAETVDRIQKVAHRAWKVALRLHQKEQQLGPSWARGCCGS